MDVEYFEFDETVTLSISSMPLWMLFELGVLSPDPIVYTDDDDTARLAGDWPDHPIYHDLGDK